jgi:hypothetical protein
MERSSGHDHRPPSRFDVLVNAPIVTKGRRRYGWPIGRRRLKSSSSRWPRQRHTRVRWRWSSNSLAPSSRTAGACLGCPAMKEILWNDIGSRRGRSCLAHSRSSSAASCRRQRNLRRHRYLADAQRGEACVRPSDRLPRLRAGPTGCVPCRTCVPDVCPR